MHVSIANIHSIVQPIDYTIGMCHSISIPSNLYFLVENVVNVSVIPVRRINDQCPNEVGQQHNVFVHHVKKKSINRTTNRHNHERSLFFLSPLLIDFTVLFYTFTSLFQLLWFFSSNHDKVRMYMDKHMCSMQ